MRTDRIRDDLQYLFGLVDVPYDVLGDVFHAQQLVRSYMTGFLALPAITDEVFLSRPGPIVDVETDQSG